MIPYGKSEKANRYLKEAVAKIRHALSVLPDAEFGMAEQPGVIYPSAAVPRTEYSRQSR